MLGWFLLMPHECLCDEQYCYGSRDGWPLYYDDDHLSEFGSRLLVPMFAQMFAGREDETGQSPVAGRDAGLR